MSFKKLTLTAALAGAFLLPATVNADNRSRNEYSNRSQYQNGYVNNGYNNQPYMYRDSHGRWQRNEKAYRRYLKEREKESRRQHDHHDYNHR